MKPDQFTKFRDLPIGQKLALSFVLTTSIALFLATLFYVFTTWQQEKQNARTELTAIASLIGANSTAALAFNDAGAARETLMSLENVPGIMFAALYDADGGELARFDTGVPVDENLAVSEQETLDNLDIRVSSHVTLDGTVMGTVVLYATLQPRVEDLLNNIPVVIAASIASLGLALLVAWRLQRAITVPLTQLTGMMDHISRHHDYTVRVPTERQDEIGSLASGINEMLERVQKRDQELEEHRHELEDQVSRRTTALQEANERLRVELEERTRIEAGLKQAHEALEQHHKEFSLLSEMNDRLQVCHTIDETHPVVAHYIARLFPGSSGMLYVYNQSRSLVDPLVGWGEEPPSSNTAFKQNDCWALRQGRIHVVDDATTGLICQHYGKAVTGPYLCVPMIAYGEVMGVLHLRLAPAVHDDPEVSITESVQQLAVTTAEHLALSLANLRLHEALHAQSVRDPLTGLFNRRYLQETLDRELARTLRDGAGIGVIMLDIDHFKAFNDNYGHEAGDLILHELGTYLQRTIRTEDVACRYGGEEFIIIMPGIDKEKARQRAEELRIGTKSIHSRYKGQNLPPLTISLGVSLAPVDGKDGDTLIDAADTALYKAKRSGRDRVVMVSDEVQTQTTGN